MVTKTQPSTQEVLQDVYRSLQHSIMERESIPHATLEMKRRSESIIDGYRGAQSLIKKKIKELDG